MAWATNSQIIGGFRDINLAHSDANLFRKHPDGAFPDPNELARYFERYNIQWVIIGNPKPKLEDRKDVMDYVVTGIGQRVYRTRTKLSWFMDGSPGDVKAEVDMNVVMTGAGGIIEVQGTAEGSPFTKAQLDRLMSLAARGTRKLVRLQKQALKTK